MKVSNILFLSLFLSAMPAFAQEKPVVSEKFLDEAAKPKVAISQPKKKDNDAFYEKLEQEESLRKEIAKELADVVQHYIDYQDRKSGVINEQRVYEPKNIVDLQRNFSKYLDGEMSRKIKIHNYDCTECEKLKQSQIK